MITKSNNNFTNGFTIVEVIVAITVLVVGVLAVATFFANSAKLSHLASDESIASNLAQGYIDKDLSLSYDEVLTGVSPLARVSTDSNNPFYNFYEQTTVTLIDENLNPTSSDVGLKNISVTISYQEGNDNKNVTLATIKSKR